jgi:hypothetical protein
MSTTQYRHSKLIFNKYVRYLGSKVQQSTQVIFNITNEHIFTCSQSWIIVVVKHQVPIGLPTDRKKYPPHTCLNLGQVRKPPVGKKSSPYLAPSGWVPDTQTQIAIPRPRHRPPTSPPQHPGVATSYPRPRMSVTLAHCHGLIRRKVNPRTPIWNDASWFMWIFGHFIRRILVNHLLMWKLLGNLINFSEL